MSTPSKLTRDYERTMAALGYFLSVIKPKTAQQTTAKKQAQEWHTKITTHVNGELANAFKWLAEAKQAIRDRKLADGKPNPNRSHLRSRALALKAAGFLKSPYGVALPKPTKGSGALETLFDYVEVLKAEIIILLDLSKCEELISANRPQRPKLPSGNPPPPPQLPEPMSFRAVTLRDSLNLLKTAFPDAGGDHTIAIIEKLIKRLNDYVTNSSSGGTSSWWPSSMVTSSSSTSVP